MDLFCKLAELYELYDCCVAVASLVEIYKDHVTAQFTRLRTFESKTDSELRTRINTITSEPRLELNQLAETTRQRVSRYIIPDHGRGRSGSLYRSEHGMAMLGKNAILGKAIKALGEKQIDERSSSGEEDKRKRKQYIRSSTSGGST